MVRTVQKKFRETTSKLFWVGLGSSGPEDAACFICTRQNDVTTIGFGTYAVAAVAAAAKGVPSEAMPCGDSCALPPWCSKLAKVNIKDPTSFVFEEGAHERRYPNH